MNECCVREKTVKEYIRDLGNPELTHDYECEVKRIIALLEEQEKIKEEAYYACVHRLEAELEMKNTIIKSLVFRVDYLEG